MKILRLLAALIVLLLALETVGCNNKKSYVNTVPSESYTLWGADNLVSIIQETDHNKEYERKEVGLNFEMAKNESEYDQIILTADKDISYVELKAADLKSGENVIRTDSIQIFYQKYVYCNDTTQWEGSMGVKDQISYNNVYYPDMLMYMNKAIEYKENNVSAGKNQGITVRINTSAGTPSGTYTGAFTLVVDGDEVSIPVTAEVWNFALGKSTGKTLFYPQQLGYMNSEFDCTDELYRTYYEMALEYNINLEYLPGHTSFKYNRDVQSFIAEINRYWDNPNFTNYNIPDAELATWGVVNEEGKQLIKEYLIAIAHASTPERNLFDKLVINHDSLDEPTYSNSTGRIASYYNVYYTIENDVIETLEKEGYFQSFTAAEAQTFKDKIKNVPQIMTASYTEEGIMLNGKPYDTSKITWCPLIDDWTKSNQREFMSNFAKTSGRELWWYVCNQPQFPYPTHFTQTSPVNNRVIRWMQYQQGVEGYLYWAVNYSKPTAQRNPYKETQVWELNPNGDGYFFYAGRAYDSKPFPTAKLLAFVDGQEDMDMLYLLQDKYINTATSYGISTESAKTSLKNMTDDMFTRIMTGSLYNFDYKPLLELRREISELILMLEQGELVNYDVSATNVSYTIYSKNNNIAVNGVQHSGKVKGKGYCFESTQELSQPFTLDVSTDASKISLFVSDKRESVTFDKQYIKLSSGSKATADNEKLSLTMQTDAIDQTFKPSIALKTSQFGMKLFTEMDQLSFTLKNESNEAYELAVALSKNGNPMEIERFSIAANSSYEIVLPMVYNNQNGKGYDRFIEKADSFLLTFENNSGAAIPAEISDMSFTRKED